MRWTETEICVTNGLHTGVERTGRKIINNIKDHPIKGVFTVPIHEEAEEAGVRFFDTQEIGGLFDISLMKPYHAEPSRDLRAVHRFSVHNIEHNDPLYYLGLDPHDMRYPNANYLLTGGKVYYHQLAVAHIMGLNNVVLAYNYPFFMQNERFISVETEYAPGFNRLSDPEYWHQKISVMAELGVLGMEMVGMATYRDLNYYVGVDLMRVDSNGKPNPQNIAFIEHLEKMPPPGKFFDPIELPEEAIKLRPPWAEYNERRLFYAGSWNDTNESRERRDLGPRVDRRPRKEAFGTILLRISPPKPTLLSSEPQTVVEFPTGFGKGSIIPWINHPIHLNEAEIIKL